MTCSGVAPCGKIPLDELIEISSEIVPIDHYPDPVIEKGRPDPEGGLVVLAAV
jgi:hypothetical protein